MGLELIIRSVLLGVGLAMDAFSVSVADGLGDRNMKAGRMLAIAGTFAGFQFAMPVIGWFIVRTAVDMFGAIERFIPWIALLLLLYIGGKMLLEGLGGLRQSRAAGAAEDPESPDDEAGSAGTRESAGDAARLTAYDLVLQGIATSIDALSVGLTIEGYGAAAAFGSSAIIGVVTLVICVLGLAIGKKLGDVLSGHASVLGGIILIGIGIEIWARGIFV